MRFSFTLLFISLFFFCGGQTDFSTTNKIKFNNFLFFAPQSDGYVAFNEKDEFLFRVDYDSIILMTAPYNFFFKVKKNNHYGIINIYGVEIFHPVYEVIENLKPKMGGGYFYAKMKYQGKWGVVGMSTQSIIEHFVYDEMGTNGDDGHLLLVKKNGKYGYVDTKFTSPKDRNTGLKYDYLENYKAGGSKFKRDGIEGKLVISEKTGYVEEVFPDKNGNYPENKFIFPKSKLKVFKENGKSGLKNKKTNEVITPAIYDHLYPKQGHTEVIFYAKKDDKRGILNKDGEVIIPVIYESASSIVRGKKKTPNTYYGHQYALFMVEDDKKKKGIFDYKGKMLLPIEYDGIYYSRNKHLIVRKENKSGVYDLETQSFKLKMEWDQIKIEDPILQGRLLILEKNNLKGLATLDGEILTPVNYSKFYFKSEGAYTSNVGDSLHFLLATTGDTISPIVKYSLNHINHHTFNVNKRKYHENGSYEENYSMVDEKGNTKLPDIDGQLGVFYYDYAICQDTTSKKIGIINRNTRKYIIPPTYNSIKFFPPFTNRFIVQKEDKWGLIDLDGKDIGNHIYDNIYTILNTNYVQWSAERGHENYLLTVHSGDKTETMSYQGKIVNPE